MNKVRLINAENLKDRISKEYRGLSLPGYLFNDIADEEPIGRVFRLNPNPKVVKGMIDSIIKNDGHCPCQIDKSDDTLCPCTSFYNGECHCNLFVRIDKES